MLGVACFHHYSNVPTLSEKSKEFLIEVQGDTVEIDGNQLQFYGTVKETEHQTQLSEQIVLFYYIETLAEKEWWQAQETIDVIHVQGALSAPENNRNQYQFNYKNFLFGKRIHWILNAEQIHLTELEKNTLWESVSVAKLKRVLLQHIDVHVTPKVGNYMKTLLLGDVGAFETELLQDFKDLGLLHLLSISGLHIQFLFAGLSYLLLRAGVTKETSYYVLVPALFFYGTLIGWGTSAFRAVTASFILLTASRFQWRISGLDAWSITLLAALIINPYQISSVGFQLSYLLSVLLILFSKSFLSPQQSYLKSNLLISFTMTVASIPVLMFHFFEFPWIGTIANILFIPFFSWVLIPLIIYLGLSFFLAETAVFDWLMTIFESVLRFPEWIAERLADLPFNLVVTGRIPLFLLLLFCIILVRWFIALEKKHKVVKWTLLMSLALLIAVHWQAYSPFGEVIVIDVGQGDSILIKEPFGQGNYLIDTGGKVVFETEEWTQMEQSSSNASKNLIPLLKAKGVQQLDQVFISHGDADHMADLQGLAEEIPIEEVVYPTGTEQKELFFNTLKALQKQGVTLTPIVAQREKMLQVASSLYVLWPFEPGMGENGDSLVLYGKIGADIWLFTGDLGVEEEQELLRAYPNLQADVLKVGHHGSNTSTSAVFLQQINPAYALISAKKENRFGHPHQEVVELLAREKVSVYRTDQQGAIHYCYLPFGWFESKSRFQTILK